MINRDLRILPLLDITGITENQLSRINREYVDHHETREGKHTTHMSSRMWGEGRGPALAPLATNQRH